MKAVAIGLACSVMRRLPCTLPGGWLWMASCMGPPPRPTAGGHAGRQGRWVGRQAKPTDRQAGRHCTWQSTQDTALTALGAQGRVQAQGRRTRQYAVQYARQYITTLTGTAAPVEQGELYAALLAHRHQLLLRLVQGPGGGQAPRILACRHRTAAWGDQLLLRKGRLWTKGAGAAARGAFEWTSKPTTAPPRGPAIQPSRHTAPQTHSPKPQPKNPRQSVPTRV